MIPSNAESSGSELNSSLETPALSLVTHGNRLVSCWTVVDCSDPMTSELPTGPRENLIAGTRSICGSR